MKYQHEVLDVSGILESLEPGEKLTKFVAVDKGREGGDYTAELHGFITENGSVILTDSIIKERKP